MLYILRGNKLIKLNADHSMMPVLKAYQNGSLTKEEFNNHPQRNVLQISCNWGRYRINRYK